MIALYNNNILADEVVVADTFMSRLIGLLNRKSIGMNEGLLLMRCSSIHCFFMKFTIDAIYLSKDMVVLYKETIPPWKIGKIVRTTANILELAERAADKISVGDKLVFKE